ncbi:MAG: hypothetical protein RR540_09055, partial [Oscillospiraceae bacterium]
MEVLAIRGFYCGEVAHCGGVRACTLDGFLPLKTAGEVFVLRYDLFLLLRAVRGVFRRCDGEPTAVEVLAAKSTQKPLLRRAEHFVLRYDLLLRRGKSRQKCGL